MTDNVERALDSDAPLTAAVHQRDVAHEAAEERGWREAALVGRTITVNRPREEVYAFWRDFRNLARFMENVESVRMDDGRRLVMRVPHESGRMSVGMLDLETKRASLVVVPGDYDVDYALWKDDLILFGGDAGGNESYSLRSINPDGTNQRKVTWGAFDDREPIWSHDGTRIAFSSDRGAPLGSDYNIWILDTRSGQFTQLTKGPSEDYMPTWSPDDSEIAFASNRDNADGLYVVNVASGAERKAGNELRVLSADQLRQVSGGTGGSAGTPTKTW